MSPPSAAQDLLQETSVLSTQLELTAQYSILRRPPRTEHGVYKVYASGKTTIPLVVYTLPTGFQTGTISLFN